MQQQFQNTAQQGSNAASSAGGASTGQQDYLDKAVQFGEQHVLGHSLNSQTTEKISDGIRSGYKSLTGKDIPIADKQ